MSREAIGYVYSRLVRKPHMIYNGTLVDFQMTEKNQEYYENYEEIAKDYMDRGPSIETRTLRSMMEFYESTILIPSILDVGCGFGHVLAGLKSPIRVGVDLSLTSLGRVPEDIVRMQADAEDLPFKVDSFQVVTCFDLLEHVRNMERVLYGLYSVTMTRGHLILAFPYQQDLSVYDLPEYKAKHKTYKYMHLRSMDELMVFDALSQMGDFRLIFQTDITSHVPVQEFTPYNIRFMVIEKR